MLAVVKKPHTDTMLFEIKGDIPNQVLDYIQQQFGQNVEIIEDNEELVNIFETDWYKQISPTITSGDVVRIYRENLGLSQMELGQELGNLTEDFIVEIECGERKINQNIAEKLGKFFGIPVDRFILN
ncbi:helix-turn-helix transcriptional regulator [Candidatus Halobeggiatoa sp. HSG11]|nr:helix-turn-helix transcriptional regulator [Candidatus Halobeggiatoa sp. HSG11]